MQKDGSIVISDWQKGAAESPILGAESVVSCDIFDEPGILKIKEAPTKGTETINTFSPGDPSIVGLTVGYAKTDNGKEVWMTELGIIACNDTFTDEVLDLTLTRGWDACVWNDTFTVVSYGIGSTGYIGVVSYTTGTRVLHKAKISSLTYNYNIKLLMAQDGYIYFTNGNTIGRITDISESAGVVTVTSTSSALNLPRGVYATTIVELGSNLLIGTQKGASYSVRNSFNFANIYPWDRTSASFRLPIQIQETGINAMIQKDNLVYFSAGVSGNIYMTDGTTYRKIKTIPYTKGRKYSSGSTVYYNAMSFNQDGNLVVGLSMASGGSSLLNKYGVWEIKLASGYPATLSYTGLNGETGTDYALYCGFVTPSGTDNIAYSTKINNVSSYLITSSALVTSYLATYETEAYYVGTRQSRKSYQSIEFTLAEPLVANQGIKISYRKNLTASYSDIGTWPHSTIGSVISHYDKALIADAEMVQFKIQLTQATDTAYPYNVKLLRIIVK